MVETGGTTIVVGAIKTGLGGWMAGKGAEIGAWTGGYDIAKGGMKATAGVEEITLELAIVGRTASVLAGSDATTGAGW